MNKYEVVKQVGAGGEGKSYLVKRINSDKLYVMKQRIFFLLEEANEGLCEAMSLAKIQSPYIVKFEEVFLDNSGEMFSLCIVMEYCEGGDLMDNMFKRISDSLKNNFNSNSKTTNSNNSCSNGNTKTNSSSSNCSTGNSQSCNQYGNFITLKEYENFFSKYLPSEELKGITSVIEPTLDKVLVENNDCVNTTTNNNYFDDDNGKIDQSDQNLQFSTSSVSSTFSGNDLISSPLSNDCCGQTPITSSFNNGECSSPPLNLEKISLNDPNSIFNKRNTRVDIRASDIIIEAISPIKTESIGPGCTQTSPCISGPTSPKILSLNEENTNTCSNTTPSITSPNQSKDQPDGASVKKSKNSWWKTYKFQKTKEKKPSICSTKSGSISQQLFQELQQPSSITKPLPRSSQECKKNNGNCCNIIPKIPKKLFYQWIHQICLGVQSIHKSHLVHLDLKSENIFLTDTQKIKIGDFGLAKKYENVMNGVAGTFFYLSPEVLLNQNYSRPADIFSLGCVFYEMYTLHLLPLTKRCIGQELIEKKFDRKSFKLEFDNCDEAIADLILDMLNLDQNLRPTIDLILQNKIFEKISDCNNNNNLCTINNENNNKNKEIVDKLNGDGNNQTIPSSISTITSTYNENEFSRRQLEKGDLDKAAEILCDAFKEEPRFEFVSGATSNNQETKIKSKELSQMIRKNFFSMCIRLMFDNKFMLWGCFDNDNKLISVASWSTPGKSGAPPMTQLIVKILSMVPKFGLRTMKRIGKLMSNIDRAMKNADVAKPGEQYYYLPYIGVSKEYRDQGIGQYLLKPVIEWAEHQRKTVKTIVFSQKQINFFSKLGFSISYTEKILNLKGINSIYVMSRNNNNN